MVSLVLGLFRLSMEFYGKVSKGEDLFDKFLNRVDFSFK